MDSQKVEIYTICHSREACPRLRLGNGNPVFLSSYALLDSRRSLLSLRRGGNDRLFTKASILIVGNTKNVEQFFALITDP